MKKGDDPKFVHSRPATREGDNHSQESVSTAFRSVPGSVTPEFRHMKKRMGPHVFTTTNTTATSVYPARFQHARRRIGSVFADGFECGNPAERADRSCESAVPARLHLRVFGSALRSGAPVSAWGSGREQVQPPVDTRGRRERCFCDGRIDCEHYNMRFQQLSIWKPDLNFRALFYGD
jgi:hypothetical protein